MSRRRKIRTRRGRAPRPRVRHVRNSLEEIQNESRDVDYGIPKLGGTIPTPIDIYELKTRERIARDDSWFSSAAGQNECSKRRYANKHICIAYRRIVGYGPTLEQARSMALRNCRGDLPEMIEFFVASR